ncbi:hypothetical protein IGW14_20390 [Streptomyces hygroscopicus subsp. hygroscopicus]|uniref:DUF6879 domain-containing protein n=1 Tax=Streptomyces demainii TaxID=588122 RepID=A0ABT9KYJ5_9ACTN|nr:MULTISPECIES: DUF6879 family protein [Streptomyces]MBW8090311.1 hypothetical protein [Streptomyces hygroscopicus subsp. hygroscopicus]MCO8305221.1 hypothetical protein [Streptomyces sp. RKCA744]MDN3055944.1 hypothetical protein [Streptomyces sp. SRF1]MDP9613205.1 hypothetical protein [Streptomyces demainii]
MLLDGDGWREYFDAFEREAWRFEAQPTYTMPKEQENVARFLAGEAKPADHNARWHERVKGYIDSGRSIGRVRVVRQPLTDYQRYQFAWGIPGNIKAGEDIRILDVTHDDYGLPLTGQDWWMFDRTRIARLNFRPDGTQINREAYEGDPAPYREWQRLALEHAVPFKEYVKGLDL